MPEIISPKPEKQRENRSNPEHYRKQKHKVLESQQKKRKEIEKNLPPRAPKKNDFYLNEAGKVRVELVEHYKTTINPATLTGLNQKMPGLIRKVFCRPEEGSKWKFCCWGNLAVQKRISLVEVCWMRFLPKIKVNGREALSAGLSGPYFFATKPKGYAAIVEGTFIEEPPKNEQKPAAEVKKLRAKISAPPKPEEQKILDAFTASIPSNSLNTVSKKQPEGVNSPENSLNSEEKKTLAEQILLAARVQDVPLQELVKAILSHDYPVGFYSINKSWAMESLVMCTARGMKINMEHYKDMGLSPFIRNTKNLSKEFLHFNRTNLLSPGVKAAKISTWINKTAYGRAGVPKNHPTVFIEPQNMPPHLAAAIRNSGPKYRRNPALKAIGKDGIDTFKNHTDRLYGKYEIASENLFAGTILCSSKPLNQMKTANLVLFAHGTAGFNGPGRFNGAMNALGKQGENHITAAPEDAVPTGVHTGSKYTGYPYYGWNNFAAPGGKPKFIRYMSRLISSLEAAGPKITGISMAGHSGGGFFLETMLKYFPSGEIPFIDPKTKEKRQIRINMFFDADSQYYGPEAAAHAYLSSNFFHVIKNSSEIQTAISEGNREKISNQLRKYTDPILETLLSIMAKHYQQAAGAIKNRINLESMTRNVANNLIKMFTEKALDGSLKNYKAPNYMSTFTDRGWKHQRAMQQTMAELATKNPAISSFQAGGHGMAFSEYFQKAISSRA